MKKYLLLLAAALPCYATTYWDNVSSTIVTQPLDLEVGENIVGCAALTSPIMTSEMTGDCVDSTINDWDDLLDSNHKYFLEVNGGSYAGSFAEITGWSGSSLTVSGITTSSGDDYQVRPVRYLEEAFEGQEAGSCVLVGSTDGTNCDEVWLPDGSGGWDEYFWHETAEEFRLVSSPTTSPSTKPFFLPCEGIVIDVDDTAKYIVLLGSAKTTNTKVSIPNGYSYHATPLPDDVTLESSNLEADLTGGITALNADEILLYDGVGSYTAYFYSTSGNCWRKTTSQFSGDEDDTELTPGFIIYRKGSATTSVIEVTDPSS